ncbi:NADPH-dependent FMN reductase [Tenacibaculum sp. E3R01]|uniref:NADPH-dependent FMN reductase n=1 Tax=Tenacibaculum sp. E3R01 TaxID=2267227 RepID=UPI000DE9FA7D|nr:NAD(P)H-dependent oxidoreductase [Tenacibaculum sp. E3R01]RBW54331.1 NADPH-dependent FMN reductase [Tenacibaculum sp. E3R01]
MKNIIAFTGSTNPNSINEKLLITAINKLPKDSVNLVQLSDKNIPIYSQKIEEEGIPKPIKELFQLFTKADGFMIASPEHNGLLSAFLKNIIDWLSRVDQKFFGDKPVLLMSTSPGEYGGASHLQTLGNLIPYWAGNLTSTYSLGDFNNKFDIENLTISDPIEGSKLNEAIQAFIK